MQLDLSTTEEQILQFYKKFIQDNGFSPKLKEVAAAAGLHTSTVAYHIKNLQERGYILRRRGNRNVILTDKAK